MFIGPKRPARATLLPSTGFTIALVGPVESQRVVGVDAKRILYFSRLPLSPAAGQTNSHSPNGPKVQGKP
jgi:hypothetical protein